MFSWIKRNCWSCKTPKKAIKKGHQGCLDCLFSSGHKVTLNGMLKVIHKNNLAMIYVFLKHKVTPDARITFAAAEVDNNKLVKYLIHLKYPWDPRILPMVISRNNCKLVTYILAANLSYDLFEVQRAAVKANNLSLLTHFIEKDIPLKSELTYYAALEGQVDMLSFCITHGCEVSHRAILGAVKGNHTRCLHYLSHLPTFYSDNSWHPIAIQEAVMSGSYECLTTLCKDRSVETLNINLLNLIQVAIERSYKQISLYLLALYRSSGAPPPYDVSGSATAPSDPCIV